MKRSGSGGTGLDQCLRTKFDDVGPRIFLATVIGAGAWKKTLKLHGKAEKVVTDGLKSYPVAMRDMGNLERRIMGQWPNNSAENSHLPFR